MCETPTTTITLIKSSPNKTTAKLGDLTSSPGDGEKLTKSQRQNDRAPLIKTNQSMGSCGKNLEAKYLGSCTSFRWQPLPAGAMPGSLPPLLSSSQPPGVWSSQMGQPLSRETLPSQGVGRESPEHYFGPRIEQIVVTRKVTLIEMRKGSPGTHKLSSTLLPQDIISESLGSTGHSSKTTFLV